MSIGASRAEAQQPDDGTEIVQGDWAAIPMSSSQETEPAWVRGADEESEQESHAGRKALATLLIVAGILWTAARFRTSCNGSR